MLRYFERYIKGSLRVFLM